MSASTILTRLFGAPEEINGRERCSTYLYRWVVAKTRWGNAYVHHFVGDDWSRDLHDHPKRFISIGLWGQYVELVPADDGFRSHYRTYRAPWFRTFPATHRHRLMLIDRKPCWTLVIVLRTEREWGFWHEGRFIPWQSYVDGADADLADRMKSCPD